MSICFGNFFHPLHCKKALWNPWIKCHHSARVKNVIICCQITVQTENQHSFHDYHTVNPLCVNLSSQLHPSSVLYPWVLDDRLMLNWKEDCPFKLNVLSNTDMENWIRSSLYYLIYSEVLSFPFSVCFPVNPDASQRTQELFFTAFLTGTVCQWCWAGTALLVLWAHDPWSINQAFLVLERCVYKNQPHHLVPLAVGLL